MFRIYRAYIGPELHIYYYPIAKINEQAYVDSSCNQVTHQPNRVILGQSLSCLDHTGGSINYAGKQGFSNAAKDQIEQYKDDQQGQL